MSQIVKCDICGKVYNERHLSSHKRLAHGKRETSLRSARKESETVEKILSIYDQLSDEGKKEVRDCLAAGDQTKL